MIKTKAVITITKDHVKEIIKTVSGEGLLTIAMAGGQVVEAYAKINANDVFSGKATAGGGLTGSIQTIKAESSATEAWVDVGPTVVYGRIRELGGTIRPIFAKMLHWVSDDGEHIFAKVVHQLARPYLRPALDEHVFDIENAIKNQIKEVFAGVLK